MMEGIEPVGEHEGPADVFLDGRPIRITQARTYFRLKHLASWLGMCKKPGAHTIELHVWETWDALAVRIEHRFGKNLWYPSHWDQYYATLPEMPASTPGAQPRTMADVRAARKASAEEAPRQYALF
jgi:hypothetical protein